MFGTEDALVRPQSLSVASYLLLKQVWLASYLPYPNARQP